MHVCMHFRARQDENVNFSCLGAPKTSYKCNRIDVLLCFTKKTQKKNGFKQSKQKKIVKSLL